MWKVSLVGFLVMLGHLGLLHAGCSEFWWHVTDKEKGGGGESYQKT